MTTVTLLLIALAEYAQEHPNLRLNFRYKALLRYLVDEAYDPGDDAYYRLTLSANDCDTLRALENHLVDSKQYPEVQSSSRLVENLNFFREQLKNVDANVVWEGLRRLQIVSISLDQDRDDPQLIFESMNSTGKDLSAADLVRNYVLMRQPKAAQAALYDNNWRKIEENLGADYDQVFDDFLYAYLVVHGIFSKKNKDELYSQFKRYATSHGYLKDVAAARELLQEMKRFSDYYARITRGTEKDPALNQRLWRLRQLQVAALNPLILSFYEDYDAKAFSYDDFIALLDTLECYAFRRAVCDCPSREYPKLVVSLINRLNHIQDEGGNYLEAFQAFLLTTSVENQRFPDDKEFQEELRSRDMYSFKRSFYMFSRLESSYHTKGVMSDPRDFAKKNDKGQAVYTIEHLMPQAAMSSDNGWKEMLGEHAEDKFEKNIHILGNLSLTPYNSELGDKSLQEKQKLLRNANVHLVLNENVDGKTTQSDGQTDGNFMQATIWDEKQISTRSRKLAKRAVQVWPRPRLSDAVLDAFKTPKATVKKDKASIKVSIQDLVRVGFLKPGDVLTVKNGNFGSAVVTNTSKLRLQDGSEFAAPSPAANANQRLHHLPSSGDGWHYWLLDGEPLNVLRQKYIAQCASDEIKQTHENYWYDFQEMCADDAEFVDIFGDPTFKKPYVEWDGITSTLDFCFERPTYALIAVLVLDENGQYKQVEVRISCKPQAYAEVYAEKSMYEDMRREEGGNVQADPLDGPANSDGQKYLRLVYPVLQAQVDDTAICKHQKQILRRAYATLKPLLELTL